jgi:hypothetical protein
MVRCATEMYVPHASCAHDIPQERDSTSQVTQYGSWQGKAECTASASALTQSRRRTSPRFRHCRTNTQLTLCCCGHARAHKGSAQKARYVRTWRVDEKTAIGAFHVRGAQRIGTRNMYHRTDWRPTATAAWPQHHICQRSEHQGSVYPSSAAAAAVAAVQGQPLARAQRSTSM